MPSPTSFTVAFRFRLILLCAVFLAVAMPGCRTDFPIEVDRLPLALGDSTVQVVTYRAGSGGLTFINLHDDENTAVDAALDVIRRRGGRVIALSHTGERNVRFALADSTYAVDPNRIFTDAGAEATLKRLGAYDEEAHRTVRAFADSLLRLVLPAEDAPIITLHNNTEGQYSALSYTGDGPYVQDARAVHLAEDGDADDFFFVTDETIYEALRTNGYTVVLQDNEKATDDGSLSVHAGRSGRPYVNAEAQHGHRRYQREMLLALYDLLAPPA